MTRNVIGLLGGLQATTNKAAVANIIPHNSNAVLWQLSYDQWQNTSVLRKYHGPTKVSDNDKSVSFLFARPTCKILNIQGVAWFTCSTFLNGSCLVFMPSGFIHDTDIYLSSEELWPMQYYPVDESFIIHESCSIHDSCALHMWPLLFRQCDQCVAYGSH